MPLTVLAHCGRNGKIYINLNVIKKNEKLIKIANGCCNSNNINTQN